MLDQMTQNEIERAVSGAAMDIAESMGRPSVLYRPTLTVDGNQYCALYGLNLHEGCAGFGDTPADAMADFDKNWAEMKAPTPSKRSGLMGDG